MCLISENRKLDQNLPIQWQEEGYKCLMGEVEGLALNPFSIRKVIKSYFQETIFLFVSEFNTEFTKVHILISKKWIL